MKSVAHGPANPPAKAAVKKKKHPLVSSHSLASIEHIVVLMLENRSFDHMLGFLYTDNGNVAPGGAPFDGLTGSESNPGASGTRLPVSKIQASNRNAYLMPGADPGEGYSATNSQIFGSTTAPTPPVATNQGFVTDYNYTLGWESTEKWSIVTGTTSNDIMGMFTPDLLPILSGLARGYAVCDQWFASLPTETLPNRAFVCAGTSQGHMDDKTKTYTCPTIFGLLSKNNIGWAIYGYIDPPLTRMDFPDTTDADESHFGLFSDFQSAAASGTLPAYTFLEPSWDANGNSQHPNYNVALGEQFIHDVYYALRNGPSWNQTLLIITYDEHGGCYDHVPPPLGATPPDNSAGEDGFDFKRFGVRVPTVLVSPLIAPGTVFRVPAGATPLDHTSILKTVETRWNLPNLTARDAAALDVGAVLTLSVPRTDDPLVGVVVPVSTTPVPNAEVPSHLQQVHAELVSQLPVPDAQGGYHHTMPPLATSADYRNYIRTRTDAWKASKSRNASAAHS
ncbi:MAG: alkaline phosphatase family protein [Candidatus Acidiferrum sp.]